MSTSGKIDYVSIKNKHLQLPSNQLYDYFKRFFGEKPIDRSMKIVGLGMEFIDYIEMAEYFFKKTGKWLDVSKIQEDTSIGDIEFCLNSMLCEKKYKKSKEFASQIHTKLSLYFKNMGYSAMKKIWDDKIIDRDLLSISNSKIIYTYINKLAQSEIVQNKYIDWPQSSNLTNLGACQSKGDIFYRVYNMDTQFVILINSTMKKNCHTMLVSKFKEL
ncbi:MAG: hypothetical protein H0U75_10305 [Legionella sp.]|nr:hypothetical protein [Legionella sp.]